MKNTTHHNNNSVRLKPHYIFGTVALATLLSLLAMMHPRGNQFVAEATVTLDPPAVATSDAAARDHLLQSKFTAPAVILAALEKLSQPVLRDAGLDGFSIDSLAELVGSKLQIIVQRTEGPEGPAAETVHIRYASKSQPFASNLVHGIACEVAGNYSDHETNPEFVNKLHDANQRIDQLKAQLSDLRAAQDQMLQDGVAAMQAAADQEPALTTAADAQDQQPQAPLELTLPGGDSSLQPPTNSHLHAAEQDGFADDGVASDGFASDEPARDHPDHDAFANDAFANDAFANDGFASDQFATDDSSPAMPAADSQGNGQRRSFSGVDGPLTRQPPASGSPAEEPRGSEPYRDAPHHEGRATHDDLPSADNDDISAIDSPWEPDAGPALNKTANPLDVDLLENSPPEAKPQITQDLPRHFDQPPVQVQGPPAGQPTTPANLPEVFELNPRWAAISNALSRARVELETSLKMMTAQHPRVIDLTAEVRELEQLLGNTPQYVPAAGPQPNPSLTPVPDFDSERPPSMESAAVKRIDRLDVGQRDARPQTVRTVSFSEVEARKQISASPEFQAMSDEISTLKTQLAREINRRSALVAVPETGGAHASYEARLIDAKCSVVSPFDLLTLFLPAAILALITAFARKPSAPPTVLYSVSDAKKTIQTKVIGTISTKNGPGIPVAEMGGPPKIVQWVVFGSEVICVAAAVLVMISIVQIPGYTKQFLTNPFSAFVTSFDFVAQFIRHP